MGAATVFFLFAMVAGPGDQAALTTLGRFSDEATCKAARVLVETGLKGGEGAAHIFCVDSESLGGLSRAARAGDGQS